MKKILLFAILAICMAGYAQENDEEIIVQENDEEVIVHEEDDEPDDEIMTLFKANTYGGFGSLYLQYSPINEKDGVFIGGRAGWIIGHSLSIGFGGCGYFNSSSSDTNDIRNSLAGGHGGMYLEPILFPRFPVHLSIPIFLGAGGISYLEYDNDKTFSEDPGEVIESDGYFIAEPGLELEFNLLKHFRMTLGAYYTYTSKIELKRLGNENPLDALKYGISFKFGSF